MKILLKRLICVLLCLMTLNYVNIFIVAAADNNIQNSKIWDTPTNEIFANTDSLKRIDEYSASTRNNGRIWNDKSISGDNLIFNDKEENPIDSDLLTVGENADFIESLSTLSQRYVTKTIVENEKEANIVLVVDTSSSMVNNYVDTARKITRYGLMKSVTQEFIDSLRTIRSDKCKINLSIITYSGSASAVLDWTPMTTENDGKINAAINYRLTNSQKKYNADCANTNSMAGMALANYMYSDDCNTAPSNIKDSHTSNYILFMSDGGPNRFYQQKTSDEKYIKEASTTVSFTTFTGPDGIVYKSTQAGTNIISPAITGSTDYLKHAAKGLLMEAQKVTTIPNMTLFSLGLGQWFTSDGEFSNFPSAPYLLQLVAAVGNEKITLDKACAYLGNDVPFDSMPGNNPSYPVFNYDNFKNGTGYKIGSTTYATLELFEAALLKKFGDLEKRKTTGINFVDKDTLRQAVNYYSGNTVTAFEQSVADISSSIITNLENYVTETSNPNFGGYVSFMDKLGEYQKVQDFKAIYYDGTLYTGKDFCQKFTDKSLTTTDALFNTFFLAFTNSMQAPYLSKENILNMLKCNMAAGELKYEDENNYSNKIQWYANYDTTEDSFYYVGDYYDENGKICDAPDNANYVFESWCSLGTIVNNEIIGNENKNLLLAQSGVATSLNTGEQTVVFKLPASIIPARTVTTFNNIATLNDVRPASLIFTIKVNEDIPVADDYKYYNDTDKTCTFYANKWHSSITGETADARVKFCPDTKNTFYYLQEDVPLYQYLSDSAQYTPATDETQTSNLYYCDTFYTEDGQKNEYFLCDDFFESPSIYTNETDGYVYIKKGAWIKHETFYATKEKKDNLTGTLPNIQTATYCTRGLQSNHYDIINILGNNGKITKQMTDLIIKNIWKDNNNLDHIRPNQIDCTIYKDNEPYSEATLSNKNCVLSTNNESDDEWTYTIIRLPLGCSFSLETDDIPFYKKTEISKPSDNQINIIHTEDDWFKDDTLVVLNFGVPVKIDTIKENNIDTENYKNITFSIDEQKCANYGTVTINNNEIVYSPKTTNWKVPDSFGIIMSDTTVTVKTVITILPSPNILYEDDMYGDSFTYTDGLTAEGQKGNTGIWEKVTSKNSPDTNDVTSRTATDYYTCSEFGMNSAHKVTVSAQNNPNAKYSGGKGAKWPTATFTFSGTGFDIKSVSSGKTGAIYVNIYKGDSVSEKTYKKLVVDSYLGYSYNADTDAWTVDTNSTNTVYQVPVISKTDLPYDTYTVQIVPTYSSLFDHKKSGSYCFYLDGITIYNSIDSTSLDNTKTLTTAYEKSNDHNAVYTAIRSLILDTEQWNSSNESTDGILYIGDGNMSIEKKENSDKILLNKAYNTFKNAGPKNEVYITNGHGFSFHIGNSKRVQIGARLVEGTNASLMVFDTQDKTWHEIENIKSATDIYYDITSHVTNGQVILKCASEDTTATLSLSNIKTVPYDTLESTQINVSNELISASYFAYSVNKTVSDKHTCDFSEHDEIVVEPTCTSKGIIRHYCVCGEYQTETIGFSSHEYKNGICIDCGAKDDTHIHTYKKTLVREATCSHFGIAIYKCECGEQYEEIIDATAHEYENGICTICGTVDTNYVNTPDNEQPNTDSQNKETENNTPNATKETVNDILNLLKSLFAKLAEFINSIKLLFAHQ